MKSLLLALICFFAVVFADKEVPTDPITEPEDEPALVRCKRLLCGRGCESGFVEGSPCPKCLCKDRCKDYRCEEGAICKVENGRPTCLPDVPVRPQPLPCPVPNCAMEHECLFDFKLTENGCQTCSCRVSPCDTEKCQEGEVCVEHKAKCHKDVCPNKPKCVGRPLCQRQPEMRRLASSILMPGPALFNGLRARRATKTTLECDPDTGAFKPLQCADDSHECWCVDDRGNEISNTRKVTSPGVQPECHYNRTKSVHGSFELTHSLHDVTAHMKNIKQLTHQHLSNWLHMDEEFVTIVEVSPRGTNIIQVHFEVIWDEETDMATAIYHVQYLMIKGRCQIDYQDSALIPDPKSMDVYHHYEPKLPNESGWTGEHYLTHRDGFMGFVHRHQTGIIAAVFGATMLILLVAIVSFARRRRLSSHFNHRRMDTYRENLAFSNQLYGKQNLMSNDIKEPLSQVEVVQPNTDKAPEEPAHTVA